MGFEEGTNGASRLSSGVTPFQIHLAMAKAITRAKIVDSSYVWMVLDDESVPAEMAPHEAFITVRYPSMVWADGDVQGGGSNSVFNSQLRIKGQTRHTLWLEDAANYTYGTAETLLETALGKTPSGHQYLGQMVGLFFEQDLTDSTGSALTNRPFRFVSMEMPEGVTSSEFKPFRITWEISFTWDLSRGG